jgi:hypothetical protein
MLLETSASSSYLPEIGLDIHSVTTYVYAYISFMAQEVWFTK